MGAQDVLETVGCCGGVEESLWGSTETMSHWHRLETALTQVATEEGNAPAACIIAAISHTLRIAYQSIACMTSHHGAKTGLTYMP